MDHSIFFFRTGFQESFYWATDERVQQNVEKTHPVGILDDFQDMGFHFEIKIRDEKLDQQHDRQISSKNF